VIGAAVKVMKIATGEESEGYGADAGEARLRSRWGKARATKLSRKRRREIARQAAEKRWKTSS